MIRDERVSLLPSDIKEIIHCDLLTRGTPCSQLISRLPFTEDRQTDDVMSGMKDSLRSPTPLGNGDVLKDLPERNLSSSDTNSRVNNGSK